MEQMLLLDQMDPRRLKQQPETKLYCHTHACKNCSSLLRIIWKDRKSKKAENGGSYDTTHTQRHLKNYCNAEGLASVLHSLQAVEYRETKHNEEETEKVGQFNQPKTL